MKMVIQRVREAELWIDNDVYSSIDKGIVLFLAVGVHDKSQDAQYLLDKALNLRIFPDDKGLMNLSLKEIGGDLMIVSQFTLYGDCQKGRRPSYSGAMNPESARSIYEVFVEMAGAQHGKVVTGRFQAMMDVKLTNWGPVTFVLESKKSS